MKGRSVVPFDEMARRMPRAGKILCGKKSGKAMKAISEFRFRSQHRDVIEQLATQYGGKAVDFHDDSAHPKDQFEVFTTAKDIDVIVYPEGMSQQYEMWNRGGMVRKCDGRTCQVPRKAGESDYEIVDEPCLCLVEGELSCAAKTRLSVLLPDIQFRGSWLLTTGSEYAMKEMPGMVDLGDALSGGGMARAKLSIEQRSKQTINGVRHFIVPVLSFPQTAMQLTQGVGTVTAIANPSRPALGVATAGALEAGPSTEVHDAELIDDDLLDLEQALRSAAVFFQLDPETFVAAMKATTTDRDRLRTALAKMESGAIAPIGIKDNRVEWRK